MKRTVASLIPLLILPLTALSQFDWDTYEPLTFDSLYVRHASMLARDTTDEQRDDIIVNMEGHKYKLLVECADSVRPINESVKRICDFWLTEVIERPELKDSYLHEVLVDAGGTSHWIPIQEPLLEDYGKELIKGRQFFIYANLIGSVGNDFLLSINEFQTEP